MKFLKWLKNIDVIISALLLVLAFILWLIGVHQQEPWKGLLINLVASLVGSFVTIWMIEFVRRRSEARHHSVEREVAGKDMALTKNVLVSSLCNTLGRVVDVDTLVKPETDWEKEANRQLDSIADELSKEASSFEELKKLNSNQWSNLYREMQTLRLSLLERVIIYRDILEPEQFGQLLKVRLALDSLINSFIIPSLFIEPQSNWPKNVRGEEYNQNIREHLLKGISEGLKKYFKEVHALRVL